MDPIYPLVDPRAKFIDRDKTALVQRELDDDGLVVIYDGQRKKFVVMDRKAPGGPDAQYVMIVQEPDGAYRPFDQRTIETLRKLRFGHARVREELDQMAAEREREVNHMRSERAYGVGDDLRWFGRDVVPSVAWRDRSAGRERIRQEQN